MIKIILPIPPRTKKNSSQIIMLKGRPIIIPSKLYKEYEKNCGAFLPKLEKPIDYPVNVKCTFYMQSRRKVDLCNLEEAVCDMLVHYKIVKDDNRNIIKSLDGSRVYYDKENPRTIIEITSTPEEYIIW